MRGVAASLLILVASWSPALAKIKFCNNFKYALHIAIAHETSNGWVSEGWTGVKPNECYEDDDYSEITSFFYHAETDAIDTGDNNKTTWSWGNNRAFSVTNKPFKFANAEYKAKDAHFAEFSGPVKFNHPSTVVTLTFVENSTTISIPNSDDTDEKHSP
ncbi:MAG: DUF1036 domain-containing protein [Actinomycetota bacterium]